MVRYFYNNIINKQLLKYVSCSKLNTKILFEFIKTTLTICEINIQNYLHKHMTVLR